MIAKAQLAYVLQSQGKNLSEAEQLCDQVCSKFLEKLGKEHPYTLTARGIMALIKSKQGKLTDAELRLQEVLTARRKLFGDSHIATLTTQVELGVVLSQQKKYADAVSLLQQACVHLKGIANDHPLKVSSLSHLADALERCGQHADAVQSLRELKALQHRTLGFEHADTQRTIVALIRCLDRLGKSGHEEELVRLRAERREVTWQDFTQMLQQFGTCSVTDHGGYPDCFFQCVLAKLTTVGIAEPATVAELRGVLADGLSLMYAQPPETFAVLCDVVVETQPQLNGRLSSWADYLKLLRNGELYGGDLEISALLVWMKQAPRKRTLLLRVWTPARSDPQDHGDAGDLVWHVALLGAHYRVVEFM